MDILVKAGANLGGSDLEGGFAHLVMKRARLVGDERATGIWAKTGAHQGIE